MEALHQACSGKQPVSHPEEKRVATGFCDGMIASRPLVCAMRHRIVRNDPVGCTGEVHPSLTSLPQPRLEQSRRGFSAAEAAAGAA